MAPILEVTNLTKRFGETVVLRGVRLVGRARDGVRCIRAERGWENDGD